MEVELTIANFKPNIAPSPDGLISEFYKTISKILFPFLHELFMEYCKEGGGAFQILGLRQR